MDMTENTFEITGNPQYQIFSKFIFIYVFLFFPIFEYVMLVFVIFCYFSLWLYILAPAVMSLLVVSLQPLTIDI